MLCLFCFFSAAASTGLLTRLATAKNVSEIKSVFTGDNYLKPFLPDDPILRWLPKHSSFETGDPEDDDESDSKESDSKEAHAPADPLVQALRDELELMQEKMRMMQATMQRMVLSDDKEVGKSSSSTAAAADADPDAPPPLDTDAPAASSSSSSSSTAPVAAAKKPAESDAAPGSFAPEHVDRDYFGGYSTRNIHELMLRDTIRTEAYRDFIYKSGDLFKDKIVLDVGCGTGILSMFAARAGAKQVIGVDAADIVHKAREIIAANGLSHIITVLHGKMEEVKLPVDKVDIIISEWMGYFLLFESMLPSVLYARDRYLRAIPSADQPISEATGVYPNLARMYLAGIETSKAKREKVDWWKDVYGFNMSCLIHESEKFQSSTVEIVRPDQVVTSTTQLKEWDIQTCKDGELDFSQEFELSVTKSDEPFTGFMVYFDTPFTFHTQHPINLSTAPIADRSPLPELTTHWQQSVFYLAKPLQVKAGDKIQGKLTAKRMTSNPRAYDVLIQYSHTQDGKTGPQLAQDYKVQ